MGDYESTVLPALGISIGVRLSVRVVADEVDALQSGADHVVDGIAAGAADAEHGDPRLQLADVWGSKIECHGCLSITRALFVDVPGPAAEGVDGIPRMRCRKSSEALAKPSSDLSEIAVSPG